MTQYRQESIKVNFPKEMKVTSPEINSIKESTKQTLEVLTVHLQKIIDSVQSVDELPGLIQQLRETVTENFSTLFTSSVEAEVLSRQAIIKVIENKTSYVQQHIEKKQKHADEAVNVIGNDLKMYLKELADEQEVFLQKLDSHVYETIDKIYPHQIEETLRSFLPSNQYLTDHISDNAFTRTSIINDLLNNAEKEINAFVDERNSCYSALDEHKMDDLQEGCYELPCYFMEVEDRETGETFIQPVIPGIYEQGTNFIDEDTRAAIVKAVEDKLELLKNEGIEPEGLTEMCNQLYYKYGVPASELERFKSDFQSKLKE